MWVLETWHGWGLVLAVALAMAALTAVSCVAMAGADGGDEQDATYPAPIRPPAVPGPHALKAGHPRLLAPGVAERAPRRPARGGDYHRHQPRLGRVVTHS